MHQSEFKSITCKNRKTLPRAGKLASGVRFASRWFVGKVALVLPTRPRARGDWDWLFVELRVELSLSYCFLPFLHLKQILRMSHWSWRKKVSFHSRSKFQDIKGSHKRIKTPKHFSYWTLLAKKFLLSKWRIISTSIRKFTVNHGVFYYIFPFKSSLHAL